MKIRILEETTKISMDGTETDCYVLIIISDGTNHYQLGVGDLPLTGDLQPVLDAREAELWQVAEGINNQLTTEEVRAKCYNSPLAGGWSDNEFQEAFNENFGGRATKLQRIRSLRDAIRDEWPY